MTNQQVVQIPPAIVVGDLAGLLGVSGIDVIKELMKNGVMATITQVIDFDTAAVVATDLGFAPEEQGTETDTGDGAGTTEEAAEAAQAHAAKKKAKATPEEMAEVRAKVLALVGG